MLAIPWSNEIEIVFHSESIADKSASLGFCSRSVKDLQIYELEDHRSLRALGKFFRQ